MALSLYRKYRPNVFADVVGQEHVERTLINAVNEGTVAHAYLLCGPRGTGKTTTARLLAKALLCEQGPNTEPCGTCGQCSAIANGNHPDVYELDAASRTGVDNVREEIIGRVDFAPTRGRYKVYIIDEVHMLTTAAFNALLKTLEEPPAHVVFILCTTDPQKVPDTIQSRCQRFDFRRFTIDEIVRYLTRICSGEGFDVEDGVLEYLAAKSNGGMRDATTSLEQLAVFANGKITLEGARGLFGQVGASRLFELAGLIAARDIPGCFTWLAQLVEQGTDLVQFTRELAGHMRDLYVTLVCGGGEGLVACPASELPRYVQQAESFGAERLARAMELLGELSGELRYASNARLAVETALVRLTHPQSDLTLESLAERVEALEGAASAGADALYGGSLTTASAAPSPVRDDGASQTRHPEQRPREARGASSKDPAQSASRSDAPAPPAMSPARALAAILTEVKSADVATGAILSGVVLERGDEGYHLVFPPTGKFSMKIAQKGKARETIIAACRHVLGAGVSVDFRLAHDMSAAAQPAVDTDFGMDFSHATQDDFAAQFDATLAQESVAAPALEIDAPPMDDGYFDALAASAPSYDDAAPAPNFDAPPSAHAERPVSGDQAAQIADTLSAFGTNIKITEVD